MRSNPSFPVLLTAAFLAACQSRIAPPVTSALDRVAPAVSVKKVFAVYEGILPCAGCQGVRTVLTLFDGDHTYKLVETYLGAPDGERVVRGAGRWSLRRPTQRDPERTVYLLDPDQPGEARSFLIVDEGRIRQIDRAGREMEPPAGYTLTRKGSSAP